MRTTSRTPLGLAVLDVGGDPYRGMSLADVTGDGSAEVLVACYAGSEVAVSVGGDTPVLQRIEIEGSPYGLATPAGWFGRDGRDRRADQLDRWPTASSTMGARSFQALRMASNK